MEFNSDASCFRAFYIFLEHTVHETLNDYNKYILIGGRPLSILRFTDDVIIAGTEAEIQDLTLRLEMVSRSYGMQIINRRKARYW